MEVRKVLYGDWGWFLESRNKEYFRFLRYTWRHRIRLLIGLNGRIGSEYAFKNVKFRGKWHKWLNRAL